MYYRRKPRQIEARKVSTKRPEIMELISWGKRNGVVLRIAPFTTKILFPTETGASLASPGDYLIWDGDKFYSQPADIFEAEYEEVDVQHDHYRDTRQRALHSRGGATPRLG